VDDLVNHDFAELEFLVILAVADVLGDDGATIHVAVSEARAAVGVAFILVIVIERADGGGLTDAAVSLRASAVVLPAEVERLQEQHDWDLNDGKEQEDYLHCALAVIQFLSDRAGRQEHVNEHVQERRGLFTNSIPVDAPFPDDGQDEVAEDALEEDHAGNEVAPDVDWRLEVARVDVGKAEGVGHLGDCQ
jgi:hypothetical protein